MSRSVRQDYDKLREMQKGGHVYLREGDNVLYIGAVLPFTDEQIFSGLAETDPRYERKARNTVVASTPEDWAKYHLAKRALLTLRAYENTTGAEEVEIPCPKPKTEYHYLETVEEWLDRCRALRAAEQEQAA